MTTLVFIVGPPAVGKMTVGHELAKRTGLKLFHNHHTIDLALRFFPFGTPPFQRLVGEFPLGRRGRGAGHRSLRAAAPIAAWRRRYRLSGAAVVDGNRQLVGEGP